MESNWDRLRALTSGSMRIYPFFLEATGYYDWLYGLQRLFRQGARPQVVVVGVGVNYFLKNGVRQIMLPCSSLMPRHARGGFGFASRPHGNKQSLACTFEHLLGYPQRHSNTGS